MYSSSVKDQPRRQTGKMPKDIFAHNKVGILETGGDTDSEHEVTELDKQPFSPVSPKYRVTSVSEAIVSSAVSRKISHDSFTEIQISSGAKCSDITPVGGDEHQGFGDQVLAEEDEGRNCQSRSLDTTNLLAEKSAANEGNFDGDLDKRGSAGLIMEQKPRKVEIKRKSDATSETDTHSVKYGVTMNVRSGVMRKPWNESLDEDILQASEEAGANEKQKRLSKRVSTEETLLPPSGSVSFDSLTAHSNQLTAPGALSQSSSSGRLKAAEQKELHKLSAVSIATYRAIAREGGIKGGKCIIWTAAIITFIVTISLAVLILVTPKTGSRTPGHPLAGPSVYKDLGRTVATQRLKPLPFSTGLGLVNSSTFLDNG